VWIGRDKWKWRETDKLLSREQSDNYKHIVSTSQEKTLHLVFPRWENQKSDRIYPGRSQFLKRVTNSGAFPGANCGSDHSLVGACVRLRVRKDARLPLWESCDLIKLEEEATKVQYRLEVENRFEILAGTTEERIPNEFWEEMKKTLKDTSDSVIGKRRKSTNKPWITEETLWLLDNRKSLKVNKSRTEEDRRAYCQASAAVQRQTRRDKQRWLEEQCQIVEEGLKTANTKQALQVVKKLRKTFTPKEHNIQDGKGRLIYMTSWTDGNVHRETV